ncbi:hypothetical protein COEREDRAFT_88887 [Coemansia reversa NRRL 1564]|uniref:RING-type E3 ubiquitin transferase n=1 Tax=Coemansia reversa (strain ATCC 12441 / NRRL 1564) TaxID=763665 RepID=A0A2G5B5C4_COERN|nr:hypothetical protein COEREDRAFT_88887 [Coemansia reversa NRRL 1564]|eukprot:PIA14218.1 hypothetical protein COEREDRAFT_88887 [Coemansia reversa NRRL 1564]
MDVEDTANEKCRFCHEGATEGFPLFYPCKCAGSIKYIHKQCLDEWLRHSKKLYCNICKEKYAYRTVYASTMPKTMPIIVTLQQMYTVIYNPLHGFMITAFVVLMWTMVFPYILYWTLRALMATNEFIFWTETNKTQSAVGQRFIASATWKEWYRSDLGSTTNDVVSFTGIHNGTNMPLKIMYTLVTLVLKPALWLMTKLTFNLLSNSIKDSIVEIVFEFVVKATEGYPLLLIGLLSKPVMLKAYRFISKECFADTNREQNNEVAAANGFANRDQMVPLEMGNNLIEDNRPHNEANNPHIQPMQANINVADERVEAVRDEQQPEPVIAINIDWIDNLGVFGIDRSTIKFYLFALFNAQITIALLVWMPFTFGNLFIALESISIIDRLAFIYSTIWKSIADSNEVTMLDYTKIRDI